MSEGGAPKIPATISSENAPGENQAEVSRLKDEGNAHFKLGEYDAAAEAYGKALKLANANLDKAVLLKNRSAVYLKQEKFKAAEKDASKSLDFVPNDAKTLFRRAQARDALGLYAEAFKDAKMALSLEPENKAIVQLLSSLRDSIQRKQKEASSTENRVKQMFEYAFVPGTDLEKRTTAINNLLVLSRENAGAQLIWDLGGVEKILAIVQSKSESLEIVLAAHRVLDEFARNEERASKLLSVVSVETIVWLIDRDNQEISDSAMLLVQRCFNALSGMDRKEQRKPDEALCDKNKIVLVDLLFEMKLMLVDPEVCAIARNNVIDLIMKNLMHMDWGLPRGWSWKFVENDGLARLLKVSCSIPDRQTLPITKETQEFVAVCLTRLYDDMVFDNRRATYQEEVTKFVAIKQEEIARGSVNAKVELIACITTLLMGPFEVGFTVVGNAAITDMMLTMACSEDILHQSVAVEAILHTASKRDRASIIIAQGIPILNQLYKSKNDHIKVRALVGLCKCASSHGTDISRREMAEGSNLKLAEACKRFLLNEAKDVDLRKWAAEGLSYLTIDADVKEWLVEDPLAIRALVELAKQAGPLCVFGVASIFVNLTNTYPQPKVEPELVKLAQFAKHHVPEEHPKDKEEFVKKRVAALVKEGAASACVALAKTESMQSRELLSRALFAFTMEKEHRGQVVQEGAAKVLISLANDGTESGKTKAANALAKIGVTINPEIAFPGQRSYEVIKPMILLLDVELSGLENYEALLCLTNLASMSDSVRSRILKEKAFPKLEEYWFMQDHADLRAAAAECLLNLLHTKQGFDDTVRPGTDRLKLWLLYCAENEDVRLQKASTAGLALLTESAEACSRIISENKKWDGILKEAAVAENPVVQERTLIAISNMMSSSLDVAARIMQTDLFEILIAISKLTNDSKRKKSQEMAAKALEKAVEWGLIQPTDRERQERLTGISTIREE